ncbi:M12 family metallopeptidase [Aestuariivirga sp.]|uniref:M12 family metallopeptidase n=1 Tax=Aestuariivirga sp. TaxID=2650926 RepID=UPI0025C58990|nr:M12 family metallopeptidase [Aestuariivirga sp.]MCA3556483.1 hypothetical protein [Aestuariivirga sp.]
MIRAVLLCILLVVSSSILHAQDRSPDLTIDKSLAETLEARKLKPKTLTEYARRKFERGVENAIGKARLTSEAQRIRTMAKDITFIGVIAEFDLGEVQYALERRMVATDLGPRNLLLERYGSDYVYDGDMIVPIWAIIPVQGNKAPTEQELRDQSRVSTFSAGYPGQFGKGQLWDDGVIPYEVADDFCCLDALNEVVSYFANNTVFRLVRRDGEDNYVYFRNAEPLTTSRTQLGKQQGRNELRIQGFDDLGNPHPPFSMVANIKHELGHELGLIHEHLRSDRDRFIGRNTSCVESGLYESLRGAWIDAGNVNFTNSDAELLTPFDYASRMIYSFIILKPDGTTCNKWVRLDTCAGRNPAAANCQGVGGEPDFTALDIEGLHKIYIEVPGASAFITADGGTRFFTGDNVRHRGKPIDKCLHGVALGRDGCDARSRDKVVNEFCRQKGFTDGFSPQYVSNWGTHSGFHMVEGWKNVWGADILSSVGCANRTPAAQRVVNGQSVEEEFRGNEVRIRQRLVDRCLHGDNISGDRCSEANQRRIASAFCRRWGFLRSTGFATDTAFLALEVNAIGYDFDRDRFVDVAANDVFTMVKCEKDAAAGDSRRFSRSEIRIDNMPVDRCVHGTPFGEDRCNLQNQRAVANAFCRAMQFTSAEQFTVAGAANATASGFHPGTNNFREIWGSLDVLSSVECKR